MQGYWLWIAIPLGLLIAGYIFQRIGEVSDAAHSVPPGEMIDIGGRRLHVIRRGSGGPAVVIEAGGAGSSSMWWPLQDRLAALTTVITYDRAGLGWSDSVPLPRSIEARADDLAAMLARVDVSAPWIMVGLSYGGPLIRLLAKRHPEQIAGMVFVDIAHEAVFSTLGARTYLRRTTVMLRIVARIAQVGILRALRIKGLPQPETALPFTAEQQKALDSLNPTSSALFTGADEFASMQRIAEAMAGLSEPGKLGRLPVAVISHGQPFPGPFAVLETNHLQGQQQLAALSSNSLFVVAENSSHGVPVQEPELVIEVIQRVVAAVRDGAPLRQF